MQQPTAMLQRRLKHTLYRTTPANKMHASIFCLKTIYNQFLNQLALSWIFRVSLTTKALGVKRTELANK